jgi:hypothetical protein
VGFQDDIILRREDLSNTINLLVNKCTRCPDQPARQTGKKHVLSNTNARGKGTNSVSNTDNRRSMAIHARFINLHVVKYGPEMKPYPLQVSDDEFDMTKGHLDEVELIKDLLEPLDGWLGIGMSFSWTRFLVLGYAVVEKDDRGSEFTVSSRTQLP